MIEGRHDGNFQIKPAHLVVKSSYIGGTTSLFCLFSREEDSLTDPSLLQPTVTLPNLKSFPRAFYDRVIFYTDFDNRGVIPFTRAVFETPKKSNLIN